MKVGSIVECINDVWEPRTLESVPNRPFKGNAYVIRGIEEYKHGTGLHLEEIHNPDIVFPSGMIAEPSFNIERFREMTEIDDLVSELVEDIQLIKSTVMRQMLDNMYLTNNNRIAVSWEVGNFTAFIRRFNCTCFSCSDKDEHPTSS